MGNPELGPNPPWYVRALDPTLKMDSDLAYEMKQTHISQVDAIHGYPRRLAACIALAKGHYNAPPTDDEIEVARRLGARPHDKVSWIKERLQMSRAIYKKLRYLDRQRAAEFMYKYLGPVESEMGQRIQGRYDNDWSGGGGS